MAITVDRERGGSFIRLDGAITIASAAELKTALLEGLSTGGLHLDLEEVREIDVAGLQLVWAAARHAESTDRPIVTRFSKAVEETARNAGFPRFPGEAQTE